MTKLEDYGFIQSRAKGEYHANNQTMAKLLHKAIGLGSGSAADASAYEAYMAHFESAPPHVLRDCLMLETGGLFGNFCAGRFGQAELCAAALCWAGCQVQNMVSVCHDAYKLCACCEHQSVKV